MNCCYTTRSTFGYIICFAFDVFLLFLFHLGGLPRGSYILISLHRTSIFSCGMKILVLNILMLEGKPSMHEQIGCSYVMKHILIRFLCVWDRYLSIIKQEGLQISQPALDADKSENHYKLTARVINSTVHRYLLLDSRFHTV